MSRRFCISRRTSQPRWTKVSARSIAHSQSRPAVGPSRQISRKEIVGFVQSFSSQDKNFSAKEAFGLAGGIAAAAGPMRITSGGGGASIGGRPFSSRSNMSAIVIVLWFLCCDRCQHFRRCGVIWVFVGWIDLYRLAEIFDVLAALVSR